MDATGEVFVYRMCESCDVLSRSFVPWGHEPIPYTKLFRAVLAWQNSVERKVYLYKFRNEVRAHYERTLKRLLREYAKAHGLPRGSDVAAEYVKGL
jgi:hypothetical protein